jgi:branched-subunit amino acid ABC-type transport system permease component
MASLGLIASQLTTGLVIGARLFLVAVGLSLIFGVMDVLNFAHGALFMVGSYTAITVAESTGSFIVAIVVAIAVVGVVGVAMEAGFIRRVYERGHLDQLLMTFAFVLIITDGVRLVFGSGQLSMGSPDAFDFTIPLGVASVPGYRAFVVLMSIVVLGAIFAVLRFTNVGRLVRATSSDRDMAALLGVDVPRLYTGVFFIGAALAGVGGALSAPLTSVTPAIGDRAVINAFVIAVIGGLGSFGGAFVGAMLVGILGAVGSIWIDGAQDVVPFLAMILVLLVKPEGLFGGLEGGG